MSMLTEWAPAGDNGVPSGLLRQRYGMLVMSGLLMRKDTTALAFSDGIWCRGSQIVVPDAENLCQTCPP